MISVRISDWQNIEVITGQHVDNIRLCIVTSDQLRQNGTHIIFRSYSLLRSSNNDFQFQFSSQHLNMSVS